MGVLARRDLSVRTIADGLRSAELDGGLYKSADRPAAYPARVAIVAPGTAAREVADEVRIGRVIGAAANFARDGWATRVSRRMLTAWSGADVILSATLLVPKSEAILRYAERPLAAASRVRLTVSEDDQDLARVDR